MHNHLLPIRHNNLYYRIGSGWHNNLYCRIGSGWYQPLSQGFRRRAALLLYALLGAVVGPTGALALAAYAATPPPLL